MINYREQLNVSYLIYLCVVVYYNKIESRMTN